MDPEKSGNRTIHPCDLHGEQAIEQGGFARASIPSVGETSDAQCSQPWDKLVRKFLAGPVAVDDRCDLGLHESSHAVQQSLIFLTHYRADLVKVTIGLRKCLPGSNTHLRSLQWMFKGDS